LLSAALIVEPPPEVFVQQTHGLKLGDWPEDVRDVLGID